MVGKDEIDKRDIDNMYEEHSWWNDIKEKSPEFLEWRNSCLV